MCTHTTAGDHQCLLIHLPAPLPREVQTKQARKRIFSDSYAATEKSNCNDYGACGRILNKANNEKSYLHYDYINIKIMFASKHRPKTLWTNATLICRVLAVCEVFSPLSLICILITEHNLDNSTF